MEHIVLNNGTEVGFPRHTFGPIGLPPESASPREENNVLPELEGSAASDSARSVMSPGNAFMARLAAYQDPPRRDFTSKKARRKAASSLALPPAIGQELIDAANAAIHVAKNLPRNADRKEVVHAAVEALEAANVSPAALSTPSPVSKKPVGKTRALNRIRNAISHAWKFIRGKTGNAWRFTKRKAGNIKHRVANYLDPKYAFTRAFKRQIDHNTPNNRSRRLSKARNTVRRYYSKRSMPVPSYLSNNTNLNESNASFTRNMNRFTKVPLWRRKFGGVGKAFSRPIIRLLFNIKGRVNKLSENACEFYTFILKTCDQIEESILKNTRLSVIIRKVIGLGLKNGPMAVAGGILIWMLLPLPIQVAMVMAYISLRVRDSTKKRMNEEGIVKRAIDAVTGGANAMKEFANNVMDDLNNAPRHVLNGAVAAAAALGPAGLTLLSHAGLAANPVAHFKAELDDEAVLQTLYKDPSLLALAYDPNIRSAKAESGVMLNDMGSGLNFELVPRSADDALATLSPKG